VTSPEHEPEHDPASGHDPVPGHDPASGHDPAYDREQDGWHRLHPLSPIIQAGRLLAGLISALAIALVEGAGKGGVASRVPEVAVVVVLAAAAAVRWLVTRWRLEGGTLRIETGLLRRDSRQLPVTRIQSVDVVRPFLARVFGLAELRIRLAGSSDRSDGRLAYLTEREAASVRAMLLAGHHGLDPASFIGDLAEPGEQPVSQVPAGRLIGSVSLWAASMLLVAAVVIALVAATDRHVLIGVGAGTVIVYALSFVTAAWRRISSCFGFTVAVAPDGIRIRRGLLSTVAETVPAGRVQAVWMTQPLLWRPFGWCRLQVDVAGVAGRDEGSHRARKDLLPVGSPDQARYLAQLVLRHAAPEVTRPPRKARLKAPLSYHFLAAGHDGTMAVATTGRLTKTTVWARLEKLQSVRFTQGPAQRALGLADVHADVAGKRVHVAFKNRNALQARELLDELAALSRAARDVSGNARYGENGVHGSAAVPGS
jgi:putative membrane protein